MDDCAKNKQELVNEIQALREALKFQRAQVEYQADVIDETQNIIQFNTAAEQVFGYQAVEVIGKPLHVLLPEHARQDHHQLVQSFSESGVTSRSAHSMGTLSGLRANGEVFPVELSISQARMGDRQVYFGIL